MGVPVVLDADGITACAEMVRALPESDNRLLLTPHAGEARTLFGKAPSEAVTHAFARRDRVILAKGPVDLISDGWRWQKNPRGNPRMAVGGTGDVLAGLAAGLMARGAPPFDAAFANASRRRETTSSIVASVTFLVVRFGFGVARRTEDRARSSARPSTRPAFAERTSAVPNRSPS